MKKREAAVNYASKKQSKATFESEDSPFKKEPAQKSPNDEHLETRSQSSKAGHKNIAQQQKVMKDLQGLYKFGEESKFSPFGSQPAQGSPTLYEKQIASLAINAPDRPKTAFVMQSLPQAHFGNLEANPMDMRPKHSSILITRFRSKIIGRSIKGLVGLLRQFRIFDINDSELMDAEDFKKAIIDYKLDVDPRDLEGLTQMYSKKCVQGGKQITCVAYRQFMLEIIGKMNPIRETIVESAWNNLDQEGTGMLEWNLLKRLFNARLHPDVKTGKKAEDEVVSEFLNSFEMFHLNCWSDEKAGKRLENLIYREEFCEYYKYLSATIETDIAFDNIVTGVWKLDPKTSQDRQPYAGVSTKIYNVDSKSCWNYDIHKTVFQKDHPMAPSEAQSSCYEKSPSKPKSIYEAPGAGAAGIPTYSGRALKGAAEIPAREEQKSGIGFKYDLSWIVLPSRTTLYQKGARTRNLAKIQFWH